VNISLLKTEKGRLVTLEHDVVTPRPYDRRNSIAGTKGIFADYPPRFFFEDNSMHDWQDAKPLLEEYESDLWKRAGKIARETGGHGGMDFIMNLRLMECLQQGLAPEMDVYDAAIWSAPGPLSEISVAQGGSAVTFPDFLSETQTI